MHKAAPSAWSLRSLGAQEPQETKVGKDHSQSVYMVFMKDSSQRRGVLVDLGPTVVDGVRIGTPSNNFASGHYTIGKEIGHLVKCTHHQRTVAEYIAIAPEVYAAPAPVVEFLPHTPVAAPAHVSPVHGDEYIARGLQCTLTWRADELVAVRWYLLLQQRGPLCVTRSSL